MFPTKLNVGDEIRILSPSGFINPIFIDGAKKVMNEWGLICTEGVHSRTTYGRFAGTEFERQADLQMALDDPNVKAIICSRGGYGLAQYIDKLDFTLFKNSPKWVIGFSDITILHSAIHQLGIASIHGIMAKHLTELSPLSEPVLKLKQVLFGAMPVYALPTEVNNKMGVATGKLIGGNLSVLMGMRGTAFDLDFKGNILFIEDIAEQPYHIDRMMQNLRMSGALAQLSGLVVGQFSDCTDDPSMMQTISEIITKSVASSDFPVCFNFPAGHVDNNLPLLMGVEVMLEVNAESTIIKWV